MMSKKFGNVMQKSSLSYLRREGEMSKKIGIVVLVSVLATISTAGVAAADTDSADSKIYSGSFCTNPKTTAISIWRGRTFNDASSGNWVGCPFVRDIVGWGGTASAWVKVVDRHYSDDVSCALWSQNVDSSDGWSGYVVSQNSSGASNGVQTLTFPGLSNYSASSSYVMECWMPGTYAGNASQIVAYSVTEN